MKLLITFGSLNLTLFVGLNVLGPTCTAQELVCDSGLCSVNPRLNPSTLLAQFPNVLDYNQDDGEVEDENYYNQILCPIMRLLRRYGMLERSGLDPHYSIASIVGAMGDHLGFGLAMNAAMLGLAKGVSVGQLATLSTIPGFVNLHRLHRAVGVSHASGYTFDDSDTSVSWNKLNDTMSALRALQDENGHLTFDNLQLVKAEIAHERGVGITIPSGLEAGFVWSFCGGQGKGYVTTSDVERFLTGQLPLTIGEPDFLIWDW